MDGNNTAQGYAQRTNDPEQEAPTWHCLPPHIEERLLYGKPAPRAHIVNRPETDCRAGSEKVCKDVDSDSDRSPPMAESMGRTTYCKPWFDTTIEPPTKARRGMAKVVRAALFPEYSNLEPTDVRAESVTRVTAVLPVIVSVELIETSTLDSMLVGSETPLTVSEPTRATPSHVPTPLKLKV